MKLSPYQLKLFYAMLVHYWAEYRYFISKQSFKNLWCELNYLCSIVDECFPDPFDDYELLRSYCHSHPYYFIDILSPEIVAELFQFVNELLFSGLLLAALLVVIVIAGASCQTEDHSQSQQQSQ